MGERGGRGREGERERGRERGRKGRRKGRREGRRKGRREERREGGRGGEGEVASLKMLKERQSCQEGRLECGVGEREGGGEDEVASL